ncbi:uncharacterized protein N0V89_006371 [Didymosphaeria variabile]|uniref:Uncharacterized protein n=1 Tax=Didymosphaeria variabile TaxID=1932322 RepID=A0A9W8XN81_9PLEO|nr:uncharacterized protein N0V89_006371 [Didymosphaeria variabile]KAJ4354634.1 hypothetical protein N0V89_006371 [Didymosphaeria variabile]
MLFVRTFAWIAAGVLFRHATASGSGSAQEVLSTSLKPQITTPFDLGDVSDRQHVREARFGFNISNRYRTHFTVKEALDDWCERNSVDGMIAFVAGDSRQPHNFEVLIKAKSSDKEFLDCLEFETDKESLLIQTSSTGGTSRCSSNNAKVQIDIVIAVRPQSLQFGGTGTRVSTRYLSIVIWPEVGFETYHMTLHSVYGDVICHEISSFTAHSIHVSSDHGLITGNWSLPSFIAFSTIDGTIDLDLPPKRWSSGPRTKGSLWAQSFTGNISIRMPFEEDKLSLRNSITNINTQYGSVQASLVHGAVTNITAVFGTINATLLPHWAFYQWQGVQHNYITTSCSRCNTTLNVLTPIANYFYKIPPLFFTKSRHEVVIGELALYYPPEWAGTAEWNVEVGTANISGEDYEVVEDGLHGRIQRLPLGSDMYAGVGTGNLSLVMKA